MQTFSNNQDAVANLSQLADVGGGQVFSMSVQMGAHQVNILGLTKRELFAALCMAAQRGSVSDSKFSAEKLAREAVADADALLKELTK